VDSSKKHNSQASTSSTTSSVYPVVDLEWYQDLDEDEAMRNALEES